jgi:hypothetical protein
VEVRVSLPPPSHRSFFDRWLRGHDDHLLDGPSPCYPEVAFVP